MAKRDGEGSAKTDVEKPKALECSFCGKTQHEVLKLVAAAPVYICDECVHLCVEIVDEPSTNSVELPSGRQRFEVQLIFTPALSEFEVETLPIFIRKLGEAFPDCDISLGRLSVQSQTAHLSVVSAGDKDIRDLQREVAALATKLRIAQQKLLAESEARAAIEDQLRQYEKVIATRCVDDLKSRGEWPTHSRRALLFCFVDVVGFSKLEEDVQARTLDLLRNVVGMLTRSQKADFVNMWGDGIFASFEDATLGLECACLFVRHLEVYGLNVRVGVSWGVANVGMNNAVGRSDVDGACVNLAARLEALAQPGEVLCSDEVALLDTIDPDAFSFAPTRRKALKSFGEVEAGAQIDIHLATMKHNAARLVRDRTPAEFPRKDGAP